jgi:hypothetical protein
MMVAAREVTRPAAIRGKKWFLGEPSYRPEARQQARKFPAGTARAEVVPAELLEQLLVAVDDAVAALHLRFGRESFATLTGDFERRLVVLVMIMVLHNSSDSVCCG